METILLLQSLAHPVLNIVALALTNLGSEEAYIVMLLITYVAIDARAGRILGLALLGSFYLNQVLKDLFDTTRPYLLHPELLLGGEAAAGTAPGPAFPSGHAQSATTFWGLAAALLRRRWFTGLALLLIALVSATRLYLGVHWPIDVAGGILIGLAVVVAVMALVIRRPRLGPVTLVALLVVVPLVLHLAWPTPESGIIAGAFVAFATAPLLFPYRAEGSVAGRTGTAVLGLALTFGWLTATSVLLPDELKEHVLVAPARYLLLGWAGLIATPWLAAKIGLHPGPRT
ncbi:MAG: phosphatase PAP2 family protein [Trueperaceae bacterium]